MPSIDAPSGVANVMVRGVGVDAGEIGEGVEVEPGAAQAVSKKIRSMAKEMFLIIHEYSLLHKKNTPSYGRVFR